MLSRSSLPSALCAAFLGACGGEDNHAPSLSPITDQLASVERELSVTLRASDSDGDPLTFDVATDKPAIRERVQIAKGDAASAVLRWTPIASDMGAHVFTISVTDGQAKAEAPMSIIVGPAGEGGNNPLFRQPLGAGTTLDLTKKSCLELPIVVEDPDTPGVMLGQEEPIIEGAELSQSSELEGQWSFCPSPAQIDAQNRYSLTLSADDGENPKTLKKYLVVLQTWPKAGCPGEPPVVAHTPADASTIVDVTISADVSDEKGIKHEPLLYYTTTPPPDPPDVTQMAQLTMKLAGGDMKSGTWRASVPNPVAGKPAGTTVKLYYVIVAQDNDDAQGTCDHVTQAPSLGAYELTVTGGGGSGGLSLCSPCSSDAQCGGKSDNCLTMGGGTYCFAACAADADCSAGYYCSLTQFVSVDGAAARQCIPVTYSCETPEPSGCVDDAREEDDSRAQASSKPAIMPGSYSSQVSCPYDEDWYRFTITADTRITASIDADDAADLDLTLTDGAGVLIDKSDGLGSAELVSTCLAAGTYYLRVYSWSDEPAPYALTFSNAPETCGGACQEDPSEDDDGPSEARFVDLAAEPYVATMNSICSDDDWYKVKLTSGQTLFATITFDQLTSDEDLDIRFYKGTAGKGAVDYTGCTEEDPFACDPTNGQSGDSDETFTYPVYSSGTYYVVVHGWEGSMNAYELCISTKAGQCPAP